MCLKSFQVNFSELCPLCECPLCRSEAELADAKLFATNMRQLMATALGVPTVSTVELRLSECLLTIDPIAQ